MRYFVRNDKGEEFGPFSSGELRVLARQNRLGDGDSVRREVGTTWHPFDTIPGLGSSSSQHESSAEEIPSNMAATVEGWDTDHLRGVQTEEERPALLEVTSASSVESAPETHATAPTRPSKPTNPVHPTRHSREEPAESSVESSVESSAESSLESSLESLAAMPDPIPAPHTRVAPPIAPFEIEHQAPVLTVDLDEDQDDPSTRYKIIRENAGDAMRRSFVAALFGHRACLHLLPQRIDLVVPGVLRAETRTCWIDAIDGVTIRARRSLLRLLIGGFLVLLSLAFMQELLNRATSFIPMDPVATTVGAILTFLLGVVMLLSSTSRTLEIHAGSQVLRFHRADLDDTVVEWIDDARRRGTAALSSED